MLHNYSHWRTNPEKVTSAEEVVEPVVGSGRPSRDVEPPKRFQDFYCYQIKTYRDGLMGSPVSKTQETAAVSNRIRCEQGGGEDNNSKKQKKNS